MRKEAGQDANDETARAAAERGRGPTELVSDDVTRARKLEAAGDLPRAEATYRERLIEEPADLAARLGLARIYSDRGHHLRALEQYEAAQSAAPDDVDVLTGLGSTLLALSRFDAAERPLRRAQRLRPQNPAAHVNLGILHFKRGRVADAEVELKRAIELDPNHAMAYFYRGEALNQLGRIDEALTMLERAVAHQPDNAKAYYTMGILYDRKNLRTEAAAMYRKSREAATS